MRAYSLDLRQRIARAARAGARQADVARAFTVGLNTVGRYVRLEREAGSLAPRPIPGRPRKLDAAAEAVLSELVRDDHDATLAAHAERLAERTVVRVSARTVGRALDRLGVTRKKKA